MTRNIDRTVISELEWNIVKQIWKIEKRFSVNFIRLHTIIIIKYCTKTGRNCFFMVNNSIILLTKSNSKFYEDGNWRGNSDVITVIPYWIHLLKKHFSIICFTPIKNYNTSKRIYFNTNTEYSNKVRVLTLFLQIDQTLYRFLFCLEHKGVFLRILCHTCRNNYLSIYRIIDCLY